MHFHHQHGDCLGTGWLHLRCVSCLIPAQCHPWCFPLLPQGFAEECFNIPPASIPSPGSLTFPKCPFHMNCRPLPTQFPRLSSKGLILWPPFSDQTPSFLGLHLPSSETLFVPTLVLNDYLFLGQPPIGNLPRLSLSFLKTFSSSGLQYYINSQTSSSSSAALSFLPDQCVSPWRTETIMSVCVRDSEYSPEIHVIPYISSLPCWWEVGTCDYFQTVSRSDMCHFLAETVKSWQESSSMPFIPSWSDHRCCVIQMVQLQDDRPSVSLVTCTTVWIKASHYPALDMEYEQETDFILLRL